MAALFQDKHIPKLVLSPSHSLSRSVVLGVHIIHGGNTTYVYVSNITEGAASNNFHSSRPSTALALLVFYSILTTFPSGFRPFQMKLTATGKYIPTLLLLGGCGWLFCLVAQLNSHALQRCDGGQTENPGLPPTQKQQLRRW